MHLARTSPTLQDNQAYITRFVKMDCFSPDKNFAFMTCSGSVLCSINMWAGNFGDDVHLHILKHLWPQGWRLTSSIVYQPVRPCLPLQEVPESLVATLPEDTSALTSLLWRKLRAATGIGSIWRPCNAAMLKPGRPLW